MKPVYTFKSLLFLFVFSGLAKFSGAQLVINQIYAGGGTTGATYNASYVQLLNQSNKKSVSLKGLSLQFNNGSGWQVIVLPDFTLTAGKAFVIAGAVNSQGTSFSADLAGTSLSLLPSGSSVVLIEQTSALSDCPEGNNNKLIELVGWGNASCYVQKALDASTNTTAFFRKSGNSNTSLTGSNFAKFRIGAANPLGTSAVSILPIKLEAFTGQARKNGNQLQWKASLSGPSSFTVERSENGVSFNPIATFRAATAGTENFAYTDAGAKSGTSYYRLELVDEAGSRSFSNVVKLTNGEQRSPATVYPTVAQSQIQVSVPVESKQTFSYRILSLDGRVMLNGSLQLQQGTQTQSLTISSLTKGHYLLCLQSAEGQTQTLHFIKD